MWRIKITKPDIIHCFLPQSYLFGGMIGLILNHKKIIMSRRSLNFYKIITNFFNKKIKIFIHKRTKLILANSMAVKKQLINEEYVEEKKCKIIYNGIIEPKKNNYKVSDLKKQLGISPFREFIFSSISNFIPYKNHLMIIKAAKKLLTITKNFKILFVGAGKKQYIDFLKNKVKSSNLNENIFFF